MASAEKRTLESLTLLVEPGSSPMCGNSICQDRRFLARHMPTLEKFFHYRNLDVSTLKELARRWAPGIIPGFSKQGEHMALADIQESIRELAYYREHFLAPEYAGCERCVEGAAARISPMSWPRPRASAPHVVRTPVMRSAAFDARVGAQVFFKCENLQTGGAFKYRGAMNVLLQLDPARTPLVVTHSSGNHGNALALAARARGMRAIVVIPRDSARSKIAAIEAAGARVELCEPGLPAREKRLAEILATRAGELVHPFDDERIIAGQGTAALELLAEVPDARCHQHAGRWRRTDRRHGARGQGAWRPDIRVIGAEPEQADDAFQSFRSGERRAVRRAENHCRWICAARSACATSSCCAASSTTWSRSARRRSSRPCASCSPISNC